MRSLEKVLPALALLAPLALAVALPTHAGPAETEAAMRALQNAGVDDGVTVDDGGVATLTGMVYDGSDGNRAYKAVADVPGVTRVIDKLRTANDN